MELSSYGYLTVRATLASEAVPIEGSIVTVSGADENNGYVKHSVLTDEDGVTPKIKLPTPDKKNSLSPNSPQAAYSVYDIVVVKDGYYTKEIRNVAIFADVDAVLPVNMIPFISFSDGGSYPRGNINATVKENEKL